MIEQRDVQKEMADAKERHCAREPVELPRELWSHGPNRERVFRFYAGDWTHGEGQTSESPYVLDGVLYAHESLRQHPCLHYRDADAPETGRRHTARFCIGGQYLVRLAMDNQLRQHMSLPTSPDADEFIVWWGGEDEPR